LDGTWFDSNTDELINMEKMWRPGQPNGGNLQECALYHGEDGNYMMINALISHVLSVLGIRDQFLP